MLLRCRDFWKIMHYDEKMNKVIKLPEFLISKLDEREIEEFINFINEIIKKQKINITVKLCKTKENYLEVIEKNILL